MSGDFLRTADRAAALARAAGNFSLLGPVTAEDLLGWVAIELGHTEILDGFRPYAAHLARAVAPASILHVVSENTPHAALQSLIRGLLLGAHNRVKLPAADLPEVDAFRAALPDALAARIEASTTLPDAWLREAEAVVVFGSDETIAHFRARVRPGILFQSHGHRVSLGVVFDDPAYESVAAAARDVSLYDQRGCLSPHDIYVSEAGGTSARTYAARLAEAMSAFNAHTPRRTLGIGGAAEIADLRASYAFRSANDLRVQLWASPDSTDWTVIYEDDPWFATSPLNRVVFVKPLPSDLAGTLAPVRVWLGATGIWPATEENANRIAAFGAARICPLGRMQFPPVTWHAEGGPNLASLVRWVDFEPAA
ncbi:MAG: acyl-CoA reductase [Terrimicrobiaceae bacterium]|nr:acyl-CoA reductase [Terrimicrobiaceae bacterium]